ncbi:septum formation protein Maf [Wenzhouxiangella sediminis]|uniref:7-methyl-GTP pyrophosphatase n=2 Tax=Wenzhouxiangella sediminis TaxID=1792836 RepID=A0A3E1KCZ3_9GAMM|nr:septum formation protein Maf [Wenzhouxiangella sediminis]
MIVLASSSPYRAELLGRLRLDFEKLSPAIDESPAAGESGADLARRLAAAKAAAVVRQRPGAIVIGSDQVAECRGRLMGKPGARDAAIEQLSFCSGAAIVFHTAVTLRRDDEEFSGLIPTTVHMRRLRRTQIERYVEADRPLDCAGAMKSEALGISLAERVTSDDPTALIGLPLTLVVRLLGRFGMELP